MDAEKDLNISVKKVLKFLEEETFTKNKITFNRKTKKIIRAIILVHIFGNAVDIKPILRICKSKNIKVVEDASESLGTFYKKKYLNGKHTGTIGDFGCLSFNGNKIITTGGGGAVLTNSKTVNYNDLQNQPSLFDGNYNSLSNRPTIPTATSQLTNDSGFITSAGSTDVVSDTTPQLGGDLASNGSDIKFADDDKAIFGTGED